MLLSIWLLGAGATAAQANVHDAEWLLKQNPQSYVIQLVTLSSPAQLEKLVQTQSMDGFASFRYKSNDELRYVLTYGLYPSTESAGFDSEMLLSRVSGFKTTPQLWVRQLRPIQESIRTTLQK